MFAPEPAVQPGALGREPLMQRGYRIRNPQAELFWKRLALPARLRNQILHDTHRVSLACSVLDKAINTPA